MSTSSEHDAEVLRRVRELQAGNAVESNSRWVFEYFYRRLLGYFRRRDFSRQEAEDLAQDAFWQVFQEIRSFRGESSFEGWLFAVAANLCRNERRRRQQAKRAAPEISLDASAEPTAPRFEVEARQALPEQDVLDKERQEALDRAFETLPPQMRQCLALRLDRGLKYREIAVLLKISIDTVKAHLFQARQRLKNQLSEELGEKQA